jgi:hypothetical protein
VEMPELPDGVRMRPPAVAVIERPPSLVGAPDGKGEHHQNRYYDEDTVREPTLQVSSLRGENGSTSQEQPGSSQRPTDQRGRAENPSHERRGNT